jgi:hypothetical protein
VQHRNTLEFRPAQHDDGSGQHKGNVERSSRKMQPDTRTVPARRHKGNAAQPEDAAPHKDDGDLDEDGCRAQRRPAGHDYDEQKT